MTTAATGSVGRNGQVDGETEPSQKEGVALHCLGGAAAPEQLRKDWAAFGRLPQSAREAFWDLLKVSLERGIEDLEAHCDSFCRLYGVRARDVQAVIRVCGFVLNRAAQADLDLSLVQRDLVALGAESFSLAGSLFAHFPEAKARLREKIVKDSLAEHGNVLTGVRWRVDRIVASDRGANLDVPVASLSFDYKNGGATDSLTLSLCQEDLRSLIAICGGLSKTL